MYLIQLVACLLAASRLAATHHHHTPSTDQPLTIDLEIDETQEINGIPFPIRAHWMRQANAVLKQITGSPCPFAAFGTVIVNHTASGLGSLVCAGANANARTGNPTLHGEMTAINNCSALLTDPDGEYRLSPGEALQAFRQLTLYTNAESCPMCASAIRWAGMREYVFGTSIASLVRMGWGQIDIDSREVFERSKGLRDNLGLGRERERDVLLGNVLANETDGLFAWQFDERAECPRECRRVGEGCEIVSSEEGEKQEL